ncbi:MAG: dienelactone hydrolase family protein, partial [Burkholderiales bacterium]|nr:dienelactone hydrolase family protein [Anaerolineae bacterium]
VLENDGGMVAKNIVGLIADTSVPRRGPEINPRFDTNRDNAISIDDELIRAIDGRFETAFAPDGMFDLYAPNNALSTLIEQAPNLTLPVLILQGENDASTPVLGALELEAAFEAADHPDYQLNVYAGLGHSLGEASHVMTDNFLPIAPRPLADLAAWLNSHSQLS